MADNTGIEWTDATWNPVTGCTRVSAGCDNCYAATLASRLLSEQYRKRAPVSQSPEARKDPFAVRLWPERLLDPLHWAQSRMIFVNSMSDLFHQDIPDDYVRRVFEIMLEADHHVYQVLTKRPARALRFYKRNRDLFGQTGQIPEHIWMGASVENQRAVFRVDQLRRLPACIRFLSCEPLLGPLALDLNDVHWVIAGGESGIVHRPLDLDWARLVRDQCQAQGTAFFFKQVGGRTPKAHGRMLDNRTWEEYPALVAQLA